MDAVAEATNTDAALKFLRESSFGRKRRIALTLNITPTVRIRLYKERSREAGETTYVFDVGCEYSVKGGEFGNLLSQEIYGKRGENDVEIEEGDSLETAIESFIAGCEAAIE